MLRAYCQLRLKEEKALEQAESDIMCLIGSAYMLDQLVGILFNKPQDVMSMPTVSKATVA